MPVDGLLVVDKSAGPTSHDVVSRVRSALGVRRVGHTGTLDPMATGVLVVCIGKATRLVRFLSEGEKVYQATLRFGFATTTDDAQGEPLGPVVSACPPEEQLRRACQALTGEIWQVPPAFSAKRVQGQRLYRLARGGARPARAAVRVTVRSLDLHGIEGDQARLEVHCLAGTYVRALARDLGAALGVGGHLTALRRTWTGGFGLDRSLASDSITADRAPAHLISMSEALVDLPAVRVNQEGVDALRQGRDLDRHRVAGEFPEEPPPRVRVLDPAGRLVALAVPRGFGFQAAGLSVEPVFHADVVLVD